jgi:segregation and condensation protein B
MLYTTTREFLVHFGLKDLGELPSMEEFEELIKSQAAAGDDSIQAELPLEELQPLSAELPLEELQPLTEVQELAPQEPELEPQEEETPPVS